MLVLCISFSLIIELTNDTAIFLPGKELKQSLQGNEVAVVTSKSQWKENRVLKQYFYNALSPSFSLSGPMLSRCRARITQRYHWWRAGCKTSQSAPLNALKVSHKLAKLFTGKTGHAVCMCVCVCLIQFKNTVIWKAFIFNYYQRFFKDYKF